jgi:hypothetical protein
MLLNSNRETVHTCADPSKATCPLCEDKLTPKFCKDRIDHWAHFPQKHGAEEKPKCMHFESEWHLRMKLAYMTFEGWEIEVPIKMNGKKYLVDAVSKKTKQAREFVHTLNDQLWEKHETLKAKRPNNVMWIYDGEMFASAFRKRRTDVKGDTYYRKLLKPKATKMYNITGGLVHFDGVLYRKTDFNCWYPQTGHASKEILKRFDSIDFNDPDNNPEVIRDLVTDEAIKQFVKKL